MSLFEFTHFLLSTCLKKSIKLSLNCMNAIQFREDM